LARRASRTGTLLQSNIQYIASHHQKLQKEATTVTALGFMRAQGVILIVASSQQKLDWVAGMPHNRGAVPLIDQQLIPSASSAKLPYS
jgi:hypothetical protein